ncbi:MAG: pyruvate kinase [Flavobacteriales bacterium]|nr:pyruvate kinase [Flavobacteriales bacterium]|tara:strand:+ start:20462 stop:21883 length:1422 start_codon:yes stop_codon:yes gene_type:complete
MELKRTKIVATLGPASSSVEVIKEMYDKGLNVCRLNFSHGDHSVHEENIKRVQKVNNEINSNIAILADLQGPKLRVGAMENEGCEIKNGDKIIFTNKECVGTAKKVYMTYQNFAKDVNPGELILIDDGKLAVKVESSNGVDEVVAIVEHGGMLKSKKGVNLPNTKISLPSLTKKDREDLDYILTQDVEWVALSFVRSAQDIIELRKLIEASGKNLKIIAKIEKPEAIDDIDDIVNESDGIMVARGDLGIEVPYQDVPLLQKMMVKKCLKASKPIIVATQMMESMIDGITPSRAEVNDVANAVMDGADAVMLSGETSVGKHPGLVVETMTNIVKKVEEYDDIYNHDYLPIYREERFISDNICVSAVSLAERVNAKAIITMTASGYTARKISSQRPRAFTYVYTSNKAILNMLNLVWGVQAFYYDNSTSTDKNIDDIKNSLMAKGVVKEGDFFINIASMPIKEKGKTNTLKLSQA